MLKRLRPDGEIETVDTSMTRRGALGALGVGFALAVSPVEASTITTDAEGLVVGDVTFPVADGNSPAYLARPEGKGPFPSILLVSEVFGVHEHIRDLARRLAKLGYATIAPDYFYRGGDPAKAANFDEIREIVMKASADQQRADGLAAIAWLGQQGFADTARLGVTGFCWGGTVTWMMATEPAVKAGVAWYGRLKLSDPAAKDRWGPTENAAAIKAPVLGLYAENDRGIPLEDVEGMRAALAAAGNTTSTIIVYPGTEHGFNADYRPSYNAEAAKAAWGEMLAWFRANGVA